MTIKAEPRSKRQILREPHTRTGVSRRRQLVGNPPGARAALQKFLRFFPRGFTDPKYFAWERDYKLEAHQRWQETLNKKRFAALLQQGAFTDIAGEAVRIESRTNLLFSFEKMALRDAIRTPEGARLFSTGLYDWLHGKGERGTRFDRWLKTVEALPRRQTRVLTWPLVTVFGFIAKPDAEIFLKPMVTKRAAQGYGYDFNYQSRPNWPTYVSLLDFASQIRRDLEDQKPKDMIDLQSFIWVQGSDEYE